jgi:transposase
LERYPITARSLEPYYHIDGDQFERQYKDSLSDYRIWPEQDHADEWLVFPQNIGPSICIDETSLSNGDLYTLVTNRDSRGGKGTIIALASGVRSEDVISVLKRIPSEKRDEVKEVTMDMSNSMNKIIRSCFPSAIRVIDRFHIQKLACEAIQEMRIKHRWDAIQEETDAMEDAKWRDEEYRPLIFANGDTKRQLLARSRYLLYKSCNNWTEKQKERAEILFAQYPDIREAYSLTHSLRMIFAKNSTKDGARLALARWYDKVDKSGFRSFNVISATLYEHYEEVLNFFVNRSTNAFAESFNAKVKAFRAQLRGVTDIKFFLFRLTTIYA